MINPTFKTIEEKKEQGYTRFVIEPLEPGFGHTLGVALRRLLLTCIEGAAVTSVKIDSVRHLFSTLQGLKEDVIGLVLNIKTLRVKLAEGKDEARLSLSVSGPGEIKASTIEEMLNVPRKDLMNYRNLGAKSLSIIEESLKERGITLSL